VAGRVLATPVNVGDFVKQGQVVCELDHRDAQLRLDQARAALDQATAALRQTQSRIGLSANGKFDPNLVPEVAAARATYESAQASARLAGADAKRYENLVASGDVSRSAFEKARTQQRTADNPVQRRQTAVRGCAQQRAHELRRWRRITGIARRRPIAARADREGARRYHHTRALRWLHYGPPVAAGEYVALTNKIATIVRIGSMKLQLQTPGSRPAAPKSA
jgi:multidrug resistance efflux pump